MPVIEYIGRKPFVTDRVAHSGRVWKGKGDTAEVTDAQAAALLRHPSEFALVHGSSKLTESAPQGADDQRPIDRMTATELREYAKRRFGKSLKGKATADLLDQVRELEDTAEVTDASVSARD